MSEHIDEYDMEASMEVAEQIRGNQPGRINDPERKEARIRARIAAERAAAAVRAGGVQEGDYDPNEIAFPLSASPDMAKAAGLAKPSWFARLWAAIKRVFSGR